MVRKKNAKQAAQAKLLAANRAKRWPNDSAETQTSPETTDSTLPDSPTLSLEALSITEHSLPVTDDLHEPVMPYNDNSPGVTEPDETNNPEIDPECLPFEDPESDADGSVDGIRDDDGWWEKPVDTEEAAAEDEDYAIRIDNQPIPVDEQIKLIEELDEIVKKSFKGQGKERKSNFDEVTLSRIRQMTMSLRLCRALDCGLIQGSILAAAAVGRGKWAGDAARRWIREFWRTRKLPDNIFGQFNESVIEDEDLKDALKQHLRCIGRYCGPHDIISFFGTEEGEEFKHLLDEPPSYRTAQRWMPRLGYVWKTERRGQFADGHERPDVVDDRMKFIEKWLALERRMRSWDEDGNEIPPQLEEGEKEVTPHWHDESIYRAHERRMTRWILELETAGLYKKGEGLTAMVSDFISAKRGFLRRPGEPTSDKDENHAARVIFRPGKERDGYFCNDDVCVQFEKALKIVTEAYPDEEHVFFFDNARTHTKVAADSPVVGRMTLGPSRSVSGETRDPSGEKIKVKYAPTTLPDGSVQDFYYPTNHRKVQLRGAFKGLAKILEERGISGARKLKLQCPTSKGRPGCPADKEDCCARRIMANQPDMLAQKTILETIAESYGCSVIYLPKFHCELNPIEQVWGASKRVYRDYPMSSAEADLIRNTITSLDSVKLESIRRFVGRSRRFIHAYRDGLDGQQAAWANKKYRGHRVVTESAFRLFDKPNQASNGTSDNSSNGTPTNTPLTNVPPTNISL